MNITINKGGDNLEELETKDVIIIKMEKEKIVKQVIKPPFIFETNQNSIVIPTKELIKMKDCDFRVLLGISGLTNCEDVEQEGNNARYIDLKKLDKYVVDLTKTIGIDISNFNKKVRTMLRKNSDEFKLIEYINDKGDKVNCYEINYESGGFVTIPKTKAERALLTLGNNPIKMYCNLLWLCQFDGKFKPTHVTQPTLATLMGLSPNSERIVKASMQTLINEDFIEVNKIKQAITIIDKNGLPITQTRTKLEYNIIVEEENS